MAGHFARHPWRVIFSWIGIFVVLIGLNVAFHGTLINDFNLPGYRRAAGDRPDQRQVPRPEGRGAARGRGRAAGPAARHASAAEPPSSRCSRRAPPRSSSLDFHAKDVSHEHQPAGEGRASALEGRPDRLLRRPVRQDRVPAARARASSTSRTRSRPSASKAGIDAQFTGEAENAPPTQGLSDIIGLIAAFIILMILFRALVPTMIPLLFAITAVAGAFMLLFLAARFTHFNTVTEILVPMIGLGVGIDYTLFIVTRFRQYLHDGLPAAGGRGRRQRDRRPGGALRRHDGGDLDHRPRHHRDRLHHQARHRQRPGRAHRRAPGELAAAGDPVAARPQDRPRAGWGCAARTTPARGS